MTALLRGALGAAGLLLLSVIAPAGIVAQADAVHGNRICLAPARAEMASGNNVEAARAVVESFAGLLSGPTLSTTPLSARLETQARQEAAAAGCPHVLFVTLRHVRKQGGGGLLGKIGGEALETAVYQMPGGGAVGAAAARVATSAAASAVRDIAGSVKVEDKMTLKCRLESGVGRTLLEKTGKRKARLDGEDLLTPLIAESAEAVAAAVEAR